MSIVLPNASASELSGLSCASDSDSSWNIAEAAAAGAAAAAAASASETSFLQPLLPRYKCKLCSLRFRRRDALDRHEVHHSGVRKFRCTVVGAACARVYTNSSHLRRHVRTAHAAPRGGEVPAEPQRIKCAQPGCPRVFVSAAAAALHAAQTHQKRREHRCTQCPEAFYRKQQLRAHQFKHTGQYPYACDRCAGGFLTRRLLDRHRCAGPSTANDGSTTVEPTPAAAAAPRHRCETCDRTFDKWSELVAHRRTEHRPRCDRCDRTFATQANLRAHRTTVHRIVAEPVDGGADGGSTSAAAAAATETTTAAATATATTPVAGIACSEPTCDKRFAHERNMRAHWRLKHAAADDASGLRFDCDRCGLQLSSKRKLTAHVDWHERHPDYQVRRVEPRFACEQTACDRRYVRKQALVEHMRTAHPGAEVPTTVRGRSVAEKLAGLPVPVAVDADEGAEDEMADKEVDGGKAAVDEPGACDAVML